FSKEQISSGDFTYNYQPGFAFPSEELPGLSVFSKCEREVFHTYSTYARGLDILLGAYNFMDLTPKGRDEAGMKPHAMAWVRRHDRYDQQYAVNPSAKSAKPVEHAGSCCGEAHGS